MSVHQIIYTSCMRGINGVNDGQQVFSYTEGFPYQNNSEVSGLFSYQPPALEAGVIMSEEIALTMPSAFTYRRLEDGTYALKLSTYLGRDYMGSAGRFGNFLSHVVLVAQEYFSGYPCEYYSSATLRSKMAFEEVNQPNPPRFLPSPVLSKGGAVTVESVIQFLRVGERATVYKKMLSAMLSFESERKRVVICDEPEHIILWIAALHYALPVETAKTVNFTTYEFDPSLSVSQICGVQQSGTRFQSGDTTQHFVFDLFRHHCAELPCDNTYFEFIGIAFSFSFQSLLDFHEFLGKGYDYHGANTEIYAGYTLFRLLTFGMEDISGEELKRALEFATNYGHTGEKVRIAQKILADYNLLLSLEKDVFYSLLHYMFTNQPNMDATSKEVVKRLVVDRVLKAFVNVSVTKEEYIGLYKEIAQICQQYSLGLATELMKESNREKLFHVMQQEMSTWKTAFIIGVMCSYVKENRIPAHELSPNKPLGSTFYGIVQGCYRTSEKNGFYMVQCILQEFSSDGQYLTQMTLYLDEVMTALSQGDKQLEKIWDVYATLLLKYQPSYMNTAYTTLKQQNKMTQMWALFSAEIQQTTDLDKGEQLFLQHFQQYIRKNKDVQSHYSQGILSLYQQYLCQFLPEERREKMINLFDLLLHESISTSFSKELIQELLGKIPLESPSQEDSALLRNILDYTMNVQESTVTGRLSLFTIGLMLSSVRKRKEFQEGLEQLTQLTETELASLTKLSESALEKYFDWILPIACTYARRSEEMGQFFDLFQMSVGSQRCYVSECTKLYLKECKEKKDYTLFTEFFDFACQLSSDSVYEDMGKEVGRLSKNKLTALDESITCVFRKDREALKAWDRVKNTAQSSSPMLDNLTSLFKRRKKEDSEED